MHLRNIKLVDLTVRDASKVFLALYIFRAVDKSVGTFYYPWLRKMGEKKKVSQKKQRI